MYFIQLEVFRNRRLELCESHQKFLVFMNLVENYNIRQQGPTPRGPPPPRGPPLRRPPPPRPRPPPTGPPPNKGGIIDGISSWLTCKGTDAISGVKLQDEKFVRQQLDCVLDRGTCDELGTTLKRKDQ